MIDKIIDLMQWADDHEGWIWFFGIFPLLFLWLLGWQAWPVVLAMTVVMLFVVKHCKSRPVQ